MLSGCLPDWLFVSLLIPPIFAWAIRPPNQAILISTDLSCLLLTSFMLMSVLRSSLHNIELDPRFAGAVTSVFLGSAILSSLFVVLGLLFPNLVHADDTIVRSEPPR